MAFCKNCGNELSQDAKFCEKCGTAAVQAEKESTGERKTVFDGEIHKCPSCGVSLESFVTKCPICGYELRDTESSNAIREFSAKLENSYSEERKRTIISNFPIPNNKEDIVEFMVLASSNFDNEYYASHLHEEDISDAWLSKIEQCYKKAELLMRWDDPSFQNIQSKYIKVQKKINRSKRKHKFKECFRNLFSFTANNIAAIAISVFALIIISSVVFGVLCLTDVITFDENSVRIESSSEDLSGKNYLDVINLLTQKGFTNIEARAEEWVLGATPKSLISITIDGKSKFNAIRKFNKDAQVLILYYAEPKVIKFNNNPDDLIGKNYSNVSQLLQSNGFCSIESKGEKWDSTKQIGVVNKITVNGAVDFTSDSEFLQDAKIVIFYNSEPESVYIGYSSDDLKGKNYQDVIKILEGKGFVNIEAREDGWNLFHKSGEVKSIMIGGTDEFSSYSKFRVDENVIITYYE